MPLVSSDHSRVSAAGKPCSLDMSSVITTSLAKCLDFKISFQLREEMDRTMMSTKATSGSTYSQHRDVKSKASLPTTQPTKTVFCSVREASSLFAKLRILKGFYIFM